MCLEGLWTNLYDAVWIPEVFSDLQLRLCVIAHTGPPGHRGQAATTQMLRKSFVWSTLKEDVASFLCFFLQCLSTTGGEKVPRPFGPALHGTECDDLLQFDYIEIGPSDSGEKYILMLQDDFSE